MQGAGCGFGAGVVGKSYQDAVSVQVYRQAGDAALGSAFGGDGFGGDGFGDPIGPHQLVRCWARYRCRGRCRGRRNRVIRCPRLVGVSPIRDRQCVGGGPGRRRNAGVSSPGRTGGAHGYHPAIFPRRHSTGTGGDGRRGLPVGRTARNSIEPDTPCSAWMTGPVGVNRSRWRRGVLAERLRNLPFGGGCTA